MIISKLERLVTPTALKYALQKAGEAKEAKTKVF
jgi:hypothetical protein